MKSRGRWQILRYPTLGSTSDEARRLVEAGGMKLPFVVWADRQTDGRGRGSNTWWSDGGSLTATFAIDPAREGIDAQLAPLLALAGAFAVVQTLKARTGQRFAIRWPNDVELRGRKVAGLLSEWVETYDGRRILLGVGINVATDVDSAPPDVRPMATSLVEVDDEARLRNPRLLKAAVLLDLIEQVDNTMYILTSGLHLISRIRHLDALEGREIRIRQGSNILTGVARGIEEDGALRLETASGILSIYAGQVLRD